MVVSLGPGKFYGTSLPRPRIYTDVKFNDHRVDPPASVTDPLMSWAEEAHWSMGGLSFNRLRLQGKIEGNVNKLRAEREKLSKQSRSPDSLARSGLSGSKRPASVSPPPAPVASKRRRFMALFDNSDEEEEEEEEKVEVVNRSVRRRLVKKLGDDFDRVASVNEGSDVSDRVASKASPLKGSGEEGLRARSRRSERGDAVTKMAEEVNKSNPKGKNKDVGKKSKSEAEKSPLSTNGVRTSPRLAKRGSN